LTLLRFSDYVGKKNPPEQTFFLYSYHAKKKQHNIKKATDLEARRMSAAENLQRQDLSEIETIEAIVEIVDAELIKDKEYAQWVKNRRIE